MAADNKSLKELVAELVADGQLTRAELKRFDQALLADGRLCDEERAILSDLIGRITRGELKVVD